MTLLLKIKNLFRRPKPPTVKTVYRPAQVHVVSEGLIDRMRDDYARQLARENLSQRWSRQPQFKTFQSQRKQKHGNHN